MVGRLVSFRGSFPAGAMLVSGRVLSWVLSAPVTCSLLHLRCAWMFHCDKIEDLERHWRLAWRWWLGVKETYPSNIQRKKAFLMGKPLIFLGWEEFNSSCTCCFWILSDTSEEMYCYTWYDMVPEQRFCKVAIAISAKVAFFWGKMAFQEVASPASILICFPTASFWKWKVGPSKIIPYNRVSFHSHCGSKDIQLCII